MTSEGPLQRELIININKKKDENSDEHRYQLDTNHHDNKVYRIVLTGGPCGGKTSALKRLTATLHKRFGSCGRVLCVPEVPTILFNGGCPYPCTYDEVVQFQVAVIKSQLQLENSFMDITAQTNSSSRRKAITIILLDRGILDVKAYLPNNKCWQDILNKCQLTEQQIIQRYDLVIHLVTTAQGAEQFYGTASSPKARTETLEKAVQTDDKSVHVMNRCFFGILLGDILTIHLTIRLMTN